MLKKEKVDAFLLQQQRLIDWLIAWLLLLQYSVIPFDLYISSPMILLYGDITFRKLALTVENRETNSERKYRKKTSDLSLQQWEVDWLIDWFNINTGCCLSIDWLIDLVP